jgi:hypothetical protein
VLAVTVVNMLSVKPMHERTHTPVALQTIELLGSRFWSTRVAEIARVLRCFLSKNGPSGPVLSQAAVAPDAGQDLDHS